MGEEKGACVHVFFRKWILMFMWAFIANVIPEINNECIVRLCYAGAEW